MIYRYRRRDQSGTFAKPRLLEEKEVSHPMEKFLRMERMPHIWCQGCGIGTAMNAFCHAVEKSGIDPDKIVVVSGIGCTGRVAGYLRFDSFHTTHGRAVPFATGLKLANPELVVVVFSGDGDIFAIGGNHFIHAARRNVDINVFCVNNLIYGMTGGQVSPTTPLMARSSTTPHGNFEPPFNLPFLAVSSGAVYVSRWTALHARRMEESMRESLLKEGFCFIEVLAPCPTLYMRYNRLGTALDALRMLARDVVVIDGADPHEADIIEGKPIICGKFIEREKPTYTQLVEEYVRRTEAKV